ncbi:MAG: porphobilinogen synthase, partial [Bacteroidia bacterium]
MLHRPRRTRKNAVIRELVAETRVHRDMFVYPYFVTHGQNIKHPIQAMPSIHHFSIDLLLEDVAIGLKYGINKILLFGVGEEKTADGSSSHSHTSIVPDAVRALKEKFGEQIFVITDVCV